MTRALCCAAALLLLASGDAGADEITMRFPAPRVEVGLSAGKVFQDDRDGDSIGLRAGLRSGRLAGALEVAKREVTGQYLDRLAGAAVALDLGGTRVVPRALLGGGLGRLAQAWDSTADYAYAHIGAGVGVRLSPRVSAGAELRFGTREVLRRHDDGYVILRTDETQIVPPDGESLIYQPPFPRDYVDVQIGLSVLL